ncbi:hypothetical protein [Nostoc sp.]
MYYQNFLTQLVQSPLAAIAIGWWLEIVAEISKFGDRRAVR